MRYRGGNQTVLFFYLSLSLKKQKDSFYISPNYWLFSQDEITERERESLSLMSQSASCLRWRLAGMRLFVFKTFLVCTIGNRVQWWIRWLLPFVHSSSTLNSSSTRWCCSQRRDGCAKKSFELSSAIRPVVDSITQRIRQVILFPPLASLFFSFWRNIS